MAYILKFISVGTNAESKEFYVLFCGYFGLVFFVFVSKWNTQFNAMRLLAVDSEVNDLLYAFANLLETIST